MPRIAMPLAMTPCSKWLVICDARRRRIYGCRIVDCSAHPRVRNQRTRRPEALWVVRRAWAERDRGLLREYWLSSRSHVRFGGGTCGVWGWCTDGAGFTRPHRTCTDHPGHDGGAADGAFVARLLRAIERYRASGHVYNGGASGSLSRTWRIFVGSLFRARPTPKSSSDVERSSHRGRAGSLLVCGGTPTRTRRETRLRGFAGKGYRATAYTVIA